MKYKKTDLSLKKQVSDMLNVLPIEMQEIRNSQERMLENENKHGGKVAKKFPPLPLSPVIRQLNPRKMLGM